MPISISPNQLFAKKADGTGYLPANVISGETTEAQCARVTAQGTTEVQRVQTKAQEVTSQLANAAEVRDMVAGTFSSSVNYTAGQIVIVTNMTTSVNELWRFTADHPAGDWIGTDAVKIKLANDVSDLKSAVTGLQDGEIDGKRCVKNYINGSCYNTHDATPSISTNSKRICPEDFVYVKAGDRITIKNGSHYCHAFLYYRGELGNAKEIRIDTSWVTSDEIVDAYYDGFFLVVFADSTNQGTNIDVASFDGNITITSYSLRNVEKNNELLKGQGRNIIALDDFSEALNVSYSINSNENSIIVTTNESGIFSCVQTHDDFIANNLVIGETYRLHAKAEKVSGNPTIRCLVRGTSENVNYSAKVLELGTGGSGYIDFIADSYMKRITLMITLGVYDVASVKFSEIYLCKYDTTGKDSVSRNLIDSGIKNIASNRKKPCNQNVFESGSISVDGALISSAKRIRSKKYYSTAIDNVYGVSCNDSYEMTVHAFDSVGNSIGFVHSDGSISSKTENGFSGLQNFVLAKYPDCFFKIVLHKKTDDDITTVDAQYISIENVVMFDHDKVDVPLANIAYSNPNPDADNDICAYSFNNKRASTGFVIIKPGDVVTLNPSNGKVAYRLVEGTLDNAKHVFLSSWLTTKTVFRIISKPFYMFAVFANSDDTTEFDIASFAGGMQIERIVDNRSVLLHGKRLSIMGDSISSFDGCIPQGYRAYYPAGDINDADLMYWGIIAQQNEMVIDTINAYAGSTVGITFADVNYPNFIDNSRIENLGTPDYIVIFGGINDYGGNPLGDYPEWDNYPNKYEFRLAYAYLLDQIKKKYPNAKIICTSLLTDHKDNGYTVENRFPPKQKAVRQSLATDLTTHFLYEFNESIQELCKRYECTFCDISDCMNYYNTDNESIDGLHPKAIVHKRIAAKLQSVLLDLAD